MAEQASPIYSIDTGDRHHTATERQEEDTATNAPAAIKPKNEDLLLQVRQLPVGKDNNMQLTSEITSPSPFPSGTPATLMTAPPPPSTQTKVAIPTFSTTSIAFRSLPSPLPPSDHQHSETADPFVTLAAATAAASTAGLDGDNSSGDGSDGDISSSPNSGLSTAAAAGIGVGSTVGGVLLLILVGWFVQRRKRLAPTASRAYDRPLKDSAAVSTEGPADAADAGANSGGGIEMSSSSHHPALRNSGGGGGAAVMADGRV